MRSRFFAIILTTSLAATVGHTQSVISTVLGVTSDGIQALSATLNLPSAIVTDANGNAYVALKAAHQVIKIDANQKVSLVAGTGAQGTSGDGGSAKLATLTAPSGLALDAAGNLYILDQQVNTVRRVGTNGVIATYAGNGQAGYSGDGGPAIKASFNGPAAIATDASGNLYIADTGNNVVRVVTPNGQVSIFAGNRGKGSGGDDGPAIHASLNSPSGVLADGAGNIYIADTGNAWIRVVAPNGIITRFAGYDPSTGLGYFGSGDPNIATNATLVSPTSMALDRQGNLYFVEYGAPRVRQITAAGMISSYAGTGTGGSSGDGGLATGANLNVLGIAVDRNGNLLIADGVNNRVRIVTVADGLINTMAGNGIASFNPRGLVNYGILYFSDSVLNRVRGYTPSTGLISVIAGTGQASFTGDNGTSTSAALNAPRGIAFDSSGNLYIADTGNNRVREVSTELEITTIAGNGALSSSTGDGGPATEAQLQEPVAVAPDAFGNLYVAERAGNLIQRIDIGTGLLHTVAGTGTNGAPDSETGVGVLQNLSLPQGLAFDLSGNLLIADSGNNRIRRLSGNGTITTVAGTGVAGYSGDGGPATAATLRSPEAVAVDSVGNIYIADTNNNLIRRIDTSGKISTVAGNGTAGYNGDGSPATSYELYAPSAIVAGPSCSLYIGDTSNQRIRQLWPAVDYTISSNPSGLQVTIDGQPATTPAIAHLLPGTQHTIGAPSVQAGSTGVQYLSSGTQPVSVTCGATGSVVVNFQTQYALTVAADHGGTVSSGAGWQNSGANVTLTATPQAGFVFSGWEGACTGTGSCTVAMNGPKSVKADFSTSTALNPTVSAGGVVGAGLSNPAVSAISPNGMAIAFGTGFAPAGTLSVLASSNLVNGKVSTEMDGVCVLVGSTQAPILAVTPTQVNFQAPQGIQPGATSVQVVTGCGTANEKRSAAQTVTVQAATPEFFYFVANSSGQNPIAAVDATTGVSVGAAGLVSGATFAPAKPGDVVTLYATGLGLTNPSFAAGELPGAASAITGAFQISVGGATLASTDVLYSGVTPGSAGLYQINIRVPASTSDGDQPVVMKVGGVTSPTGGFITVKH
jgi:uncharacterized protein (TIGR03437 family)